MKQPALGNRALAVFGLFAREWAPKNRREKSVAAQRKKRDFLSPEYMRSIVTHLKMAYTIGMETNMNDHTGQG